MRWLIACEYSGTVRDAFTAAGHDATSCDLLPSETPGKHYTGSVLDILNDGWDGMIAFPPCTDIAASGSSHFEKKRQDGRQQKSIEFFLTLANAPIPVKALENPVGIMSTLYRKPDQIIEPWYFGDPIPKKTCLWLTNLPPLVYATCDNLFEKKTAVEPHYIVYNSKKNKCGYSRYSVFGTYGTKDRGKRRSKFFTGIASAMATQWPPHAMAWKNAIKVNSSIYANL